MRPRIINHRCRFLLFAILGVFFGFFICVLLVYVPHRDVLTDPFVYMEHLLWPQPNISSGRMFRDP